MSWYDLFLKLYLPVMSNMLFSDLYIFGYCNAVYKKFKRDNTGDFVCQCHPSSFIS